MMPSLERARWGMMTECSGCAGGCHFHERDILKAIRQLKNMMQDSNMEMGLSEKRFYRILKKVFGRTLVT